MSEMTTAANILRDLDNDELIRCAMMDQDFDPEEITKKLVPAKGSVQKSDTTSGIGSSNWSDDSEEEDGDHSADTHIEKLKNALELPVVNVSPIGSLSGEISLNISVPELLNLLPKQEGANSASSPALVLQDCDASKDSSSSDSSDSSSDSESSSSDSESSSSCSSSVSSDAKASSQCEEADGLTLLVTSGFDEVMSEIAIEERCTNELLSKISLSQLGESSLDEQGKREEPSAGKKLADSLKSSKPKSPSTDRLNRDETRKDEREYRYRKREHRRSRSPPSSRYPRDRNHHRHQYRDHYDRHERRRRHRSRSRSCSRSRFRSRSRSYSWSRSRSPSPRSAGRHHHRDHDHRRSRYDYRNGRRYREPGPEIDGKVWYEEDGKKRSEKRREGYGDSSEFDDKNEDRRYYHHGHRLHEHSKDLHHETRDRDRRGADSRDHHTSPPLQSNVADSTISDAELAANNQMPYAEGLMMPYPPEYFEGGHGHGPTFQFPMSYLSAAIPHPNEEGGCMVSGFPDMMGDALVIPPMIGDSSSPRRLSLDERLEIEMGIKVDGPKKMNYYNNQGPYHQGTQFQPGGSQAYRQPPSCVSHSKKEKHEAAANEADSKLDNNDEIINAETGCTSTTMDQEKEVEEVFRHKAIFPLPEPGKGILVSAGFREKDPEVITRKGVQFADGVNPGYGTEPSDGEEMRSPPPPSILEREKLKLKKLKRKRDRAKRRQELKAKEALEMNLNADIPPPPSTQFPFCHPGILYQVFPKYAVLYAQVLAEKGFDIVFEGTHQINQLPGGVPITDPALGVVPLHPEEQSILPVKKENLAHIHISRASRNKKPKVMDPHTDMSAPYDYEPKINPSNLIEITCSFVTEKREITTVSPPMRDPSSLTSPPATTITQINFDPIPSTKPPIFTPPTRLPITPRKNGSKPGTEGSPIPILIRSRTPPPNVFPHSIAETDLEGNVLN